MGESLIRHLAVAAAEAIVVAGEFDRFVSMWNPDTCEQLAEFETIMEFGGRRLALSSDGARCFAAAYHVHGIACYDALRGSQLWARRELKRAQVLRPAITSDTLFCGFEGRASATLDAASGEELSRHRGVRDIRESQYSPFRLVERSDLVLQNGSGRSIARFERETFAVLSTAFSDEYVAISEAGGGVRFINLKDTTQCARYQPKSGSHVLELAYSPYLKMFVAVEWPYSNGGAKRLLCISAETGSAECTGMLGKPAETAFLKGAKEVLTSAGDIVNCETGQTLRELPFRRHRACG